MVQFKGDALGGAGLTLIF